MRLTTLCVPETWEGRGHQLSQTLLWPISEAFVGESAAEQMSYRTLIESLNPVDPLQNEDF